MPALFLALALLAFAPTAAGAGAPPCSDGACFPGGGDAATDCFAELEGVHANSPFSAPDDPEPVPKTEQRCFDGDAGCDLDGEPNGRCLFPVDVCLFNQDPNLPGCIPSAVTAATASAGKGKKGKKLQKELQRLLPASASACTEGHTVTVKLTGKGKTQPGSVTVSVSATTGAGTDSDELVLTCLPRLWPAHGYDAYNTRATRRTSIKPGKVKRLQEKWDFPTAGNVSSTPTVSESRVYATSWDGFVYAIDRETGAEDWHFDTGSAAGLVPGVQASATLTPEGRLLVGDANATVHCLDAETGEPLWQRDLSMLPQDHIWGSATVVNNRVLVPIASASDNPCTKGRVVALDLDTGEPLWTARTAPDRVCENESTRGCSVDDDCPGSRCVGMCSGNRGIPCSIDEECDAAGAGTCEDVIGGGVTATPAADPSGETVFMASVGCYTGPRVGNADRIFRIRASDGHIEWALPEFPPEAFGSPPFNDYGFLNGPIVVNGKKPFLVAASKDGKIYALDAISGGELYTNTVGDVSLVPDQFASFGLFNGPAALAGKRLFTSLNGFSDGSPSGIVHTQAFKVKNGKHNWDASFDVGQTWGAVSVGGNVVYVGSANVAGAKHQFYAFNAKNGKLLRTFELPASTSSGPSIVDGELFIGYGLGVVVPETSGVRAYELP